MSMSLKRDEEYPSSKIAIAALALVLLIIILFFARLMDMVDLITKERH